MKKTVVCGAGIGGLVSAIYMAHKGHDVSIFEKNSVPGGKMGEYKREGYRFDTGPAILTLPHVFEEFFKSIGRNMNDYFEFVRLDSSCKYFWSDNTVFDSYSDQQKLSKELKNVFGEIEENNYFRYLDYGKLFYDLAENNFLKEEFKIRKYISKRGIKNLTKFISGRSVNDVSNKFFKDRKLKQLMDRFSTYNGSTPFLAPQIFSIIPYIEHKFGTYYVKGGIYEIAMSLEKICKEMNIEINYRHELTNTESNNKLISKLIFKTGEDKIYETGDFDNVIMNFTNNRSIMNDDYFESEDWSCSAFILLMGIDKEYKELSYHNILFSDNYEKEFIDIFEKKIPADDMTVSICISQKCDSADAPNKCGNWFVHVDAPFLNSNSIWTEENIENYKNKILNRIDSFTYMFNDSIRNHIKFCEVITPVDFLKNYNSEFGSIHGLSSNSLYTIIKRPKNKSQKFDNLYFAGGNTHPGGGVPLCFISGKIVSELL